MKKILLALGVISCSASFSFAGVCGSGTQQTIYNPFTNKLDYVCVYVSGGGGGASTLQVSLGGTQVSSPTVTINFSSFSFTANQSPVGQANIGINFSSVASQSDLANYLTLSSATATYLQITSSGSFLSISSATANFLTQSSATVTYIQIGSSGTFLSVSSATANYLTLSSATATYIQIASSGSFIQNSNTLKSGTTFFVSSGSVSGQLNINVPSSSPADIIQIYNGSQKIWSVGHSSGSIDMAGAMNYIGATINNAASYTAKGTDSVFMDSGTVNQTITLSLISSYHVGHQIYVAQESTNTTTISPTSPNTINGNNTSLVIPQIGGSVLLISDGVNEWTALISTGSTGGGGSTSPGGSNTNVQFNNASSFGGDNGFQYDNSVSSLTLKGSMVVGSTTSKKEFSLIAGSVTTNADLHIQASFPNAGGGFHPEIRLYSYLPRGSGGSSLGRFIIGPSSNSLEGVETYPLTRLELWNGGNGISGEIYHYIDGILIEEQQNGGIFFYKPAAYLSDLLDITQSAGSLGMVPVSQGGGGTGFLWETPSASGGTSVSAFGGIYTSSANVLQTNISTTPVKLAVFSVNGDSNQTTPSFSSSQITVSTTGAFNIFANIVSTGTGNFNQFFWIAVNGSTTVFSCQDTPSARCTFSGVKNLNNGDIVTILTSVNLVGASSITVTDAQLYVSAVGGSGGSGGGGGTGGVSVYPATSTIIASQNITGIFYKYLYAGQAKLPGASFPFISNSTNELTTAVYFDDTSTQSVTFPSFSLNQYDGRPLFADIIFHSTATTGTVNWGVYTATMTPNIYSVSQDSPVYSVVVTTSVTVGAVSNMPLKATVSLSNTTALNGDMLTIKLEREAGLNDSSVGFGRVTEVDIYE